MGYESHIRATGKPSIAPKLPFVKASAGYKPLEFGVYDPHDRYQHSKGPRIEHVFVYWQAIDRLMLAAKMRLAVRRKRTLMVTVEPYTKAANWRDGGDRLFADITRGKFDGEIVAVCCAISSFPGNYWIRWGHEMEEPTRRYPWARRDASGYIKAYRYFVDACRKIAPRAHFVWSPKGEAALQDYYPGNAYVDMVGVAVWGLEKWDRDRYATTRDFAETFMEKYRRIERFGKPVIVAELGVAGHANYRQQWMSQISEFSTGRNPFPLLTGIIYFNDKEPYHWPDGYGSPDWSRTILEFGRKEVKDIAPANEQGSPADRNSPIIIRRENFFVGR
jgi:beta-mannanase